MGAGVKTKRELIPPMVKSAKKQRPERSPQKREPNDVGKAGPAKSREKPKKLGPLTGIARELFTHVLNSIAFERYRECCAVENLATRFCKTPGRLKPAIRKLVEQGYVTVEGNLYPVIYPTVAAIRHQDPKLSKAKAQRILAKVKRQS